MEATSENLSASNPAPSLPARPDTSLVSERLTNAEIESLRRDLQESADWLKREIERESTAGGKRS